MTSHYDLKLISTPCLESNIFCNSALKWLNRNNEITPRAKTVIRRPMYTFSIVLTHGRPSSDSSNFWRYKISFISTGWNLKNPRHFVTKFCHIFFCVPVSLFHLLPFIRFVFQRFLSSQTLISNLGLSRFLLCQFWVHTCPKTEIFDNFTS